MMMMMLEIALGPMLWIVFGATALGTGAAIFVAASKQRWPLALAGIALPFAAASVGAGLELYYLTRAIAEEGSSLSVVGPSLARALMLSMLGFPGTLAPAIPAAIGAPKETTSRLLLLPLLSIPIFTIAQVWFGYPATALIRLVPYFGIAGILAKRRASFEILLPVVAAGESAALAVAHVGLLSSLASSGSAEIMAAGASELAVGRWLGVAAFAAVAVAVALDPRRRPLALLVLLPLSAAAAWIADGTERIIDLVR